MKHVGILGGTYPSTAFFLNYLCRRAAERTESFNNPRITLHLETVSCYLRSEQRDWPEIVSRSVAILSKAGVDFVVCPANTVADVVRELSLPIPVLDVREAIRERVRTRNVRNLGVIGTTATVCGETYRRLTEEESAHYIVPPPDQQSEINRIIREELIDGRFLPDSCDFLRRSIAALFRSGADAVVLGCTELPLAIPETLDDERCIDSCTLLAEAALTEALGERDCPSLDIS